jgi:hypothetical protein
MPTSAVKYDATAVDVKLMEDRLVVVLADGRELAAPLAWFPRLWTHPPSSAAIVVGGGHVIHWPDVDEDVSIASLLRAA